MPKFTFFHWARAHPPDAQVPTHLRASVADFVDFAERLLAITLSPQQFCWLEAYALLALQRPTSSEARHVVSLVGQFQWLAGSASRSGTWHRECQPTSLRMLSVNQDELSRTLTQWFLDAARVLAPGTPPLTQEVADSFLELQLLATCLARSRAGDPNVEQDPMGVIAALVERYPDYSVEQQLAIAETPTTLYDARRSWASLPEHQREQIGEHLIGVFGVALPHQQVMPSARPKPVSGKYPARASSTALGSWARCLAQPPIGEPKRVARRS
jgi:hypothetical protein